MSLLPEFNQHFIDLWHIEVGRELARGKEPDAMQILRDLLNPDINPLTFEEVKAWFDRKWAECSHPFNIHILTGQENAYRIIKEPAISKIKSYFFLHKNGFTQSGMDCDFIIPYEPEIIFNHLPKGLITTPLELFCQMKGYVDQ